MTSPIKPTETQEQRYDELLALCGACDAGLTMSCTCPSTRDLQIALLQALRDAERLDGLLTAADALLDVTRPGHRFDGCNLCRAWNDVKNITWSLMPNGPINELVQKIGYPKKGTK